MKIFEQIHIILREGHIVKFREGDIIELNDGKMFELLYNKYRLSDNGFYLENRYYIVNRVTRLNQRFSPFTFPFVVIGNIKTTPHLLDSFDLFSHIKSTQEKYKRCSVKKLVDILARRLNELARNL